MNEDESSTTNEKSIKPPKNNTKSNESSTTTTTPTTTCNTSMSTDTRQEIKRLEAGRKKYDLTSEEIKQILQKQRTNKDNNNDDDLLLDMNNDIEDELDLTITQKFNLFIYGSLFIGCIYVLNRDYDSVVTMWFVRMFPREAKTLGFRMY